MITDLGVDRDYAKKGIGSRMLAVARAAAGSERDIILFIYANDEAVPFYEKCGLSRSRSMMELTDVDWTGFTVTPETLGEYRRLKGK